jgi:hypothetical protein
MATCAQRRNQYKQIYEDLNDRVQARSITKAQRRLLLTALVRTQIRTRPLLNML